jgi:hypothetical protein
LYRVSPFQVYHTSTSCLQCDLEFFMFVVMKTFVTVLYEWEYNKNIQIFTKMDLVQQLLILWKIKENKISDNMHTFGICINIR